MKANERTAKSAALEPWFDSHLQRDIYLSLLHTEPEPGEESPAIPDSVLKAALLERAVEDIRRILSLRTAKPALNTLIQKGSIGEDLWQRFQREEKEMEEEVRDVVTEVQILSQGLISRTKLVTRLMPLQRTGVMLYFRVPMR